MTRTTENAFDAVIIGGGHAGVEAAWRLRQGGFAGGIALLGAEAGLPYHRPPLSKAFLSGGDTVGYLLLRPGEAYGKQNITWRPNSLVTSIDRVDHLLNLAGGSKLSYGRLIIATGGRPRRLALPGAELGGIHFLRSIADADRLRIDLLAGKRLVIIGAGYIGLEVAASAVSAGLDVEIVEFAPRALARVAGPELSAFFEDVHTRAGVRFRFNTGVEGFLAAHHDGSRAGAVRCSGGVELAADLVLVAAGLVPNVELAKEAGLEIGSGIVVDEFCRSSDPHILAIGDCAEFPLPFLNGKRVRLESVSNALEHARIAASVLNGNPKAYNTTPWFWSDQYHYKLQSVGLSQGYDKAVIRPSENPECFMVFYLLGDRVIAADLVSCMSEFNAAKQLVAERISVDRAALADPAIDIKSLIAVKH